jgi:hypothetical protein
LLHEQRQHTFEHTDMRRWSIWASYRDVEGRGLAETYHALLEAPSREEALTLAVTGQRLPVGFTCDDDVPEPEWHTPGRHMLVEAHESLQTWADKDGHAWEIGFDWVEEVAEPAR